jgi:hypothetical protein
MLKYKLTNKEIKELDNYWKFIDIFSIIDKNLSNNWYTNGDGMFGAYQYRKYIIPIIQKLYTPYKFYFYEKILNKLLWNLLIYLNFDISNIDITEKNKLYTTCNIISNELKIKRSYSHKVYISDEKKNIDYVFNYYQNINKINVINKIFKVMRTKKLYDKVINNKKYFYNIKIKNNDIYYYPYDYPFPNINLLFYNTNNKKIWIDRIIKLYFTNDNSGYFDAKSYRRTSDAASIALLDSQPLSGLSSSAASLEIPEVYTFDGQTYDLINQFDFRPSIARTAEPSLTSGDAPINPVDTNTFNQTDDKKFPVPDSLCTTTIEHYIGRIDDVYIGEKSNIFVLQGIPDENPRKRLVSNTPKNALKLQTISVPAYPNITKILSKNIAGVINTKIGNEKFVNNKLKNRIVIPLLNAKAQQTTQPMVYSMEDIGSLERRIADLEYYVSLSILETNITNKIIPSSVDPTINRFKFGFFADDFSSELYSSTTDPQYAASIETEGEDAAGQLASPLNAATGAVDKSNPLSTTGAFSSTIQQRATNRLVPPKTNWLLRHYTDNLPYVDYKIIEQTTVTKRPVACVPDIQTVVTNVVSNSYFFTQQTTTNGKEEKIDNVRFGSKAGPVTLYFYSYTAGDEYYIFQGNTQVSGSQDISSGHNTNFNHVSALTANDKNFLSTNPAAAGWYNLNKIPDLSKTFQRVPGKLDYVTYAGKISFNHNPANGLDYSIKVKKGTGSVIWKYLLEYPGESQSAILTDVNKCGIFVDQPIFQGTMKVNKNVAWSCSAAFRINEDTYTAFTVECTGLKPNTFHDFLLEGVPYRDIIQNSKAVANINLTNNLILDPIANEVSQQTTAPKLLSNANGKLDFLVFVPLSYESWIVNELLTVGGVNSTGITKQTVGSSGYSSLEVRDNTGSVAKIVIPNRLPTKILPQDPKGNV